jgi:bisphosphoglycerate-dependent phosphoglycerate mutase
MQVNKMIWNYCRLHTIFWRNFSLGQDIVQQQVTNFATNFYKQFNQGGRVGFADGPKNPGKRKTMKILAGLASLPILGRFFDVAQVAEKAAPAVVETFKNAPSHFIGLVNKIRALGRIIDPKKLLRYDKEKISNVYDYGDYRMYEKLDGGVEIQKEKFMGTNYGDAKVSEEYMSYNPKTPKFNKKGEKIPDEYEEVYEEYTAYPDSEGKMKDIYESVEPNTIDEGTYSKEELEQLIVEQIEDSIKKGKK